MKMIRNYLIAGAVLASGVAVIQSARVIGQDKQPITVTLEAAQLPAVATQTVTATPAVTATQAALAATGFPGFPEFLTAPLTAPPTLAVASAEELPSPSRFAIPSPTRQLAVTSAEELSSPAQPATRITATLRGEYPAATQPATVPGTLGNLGALDPAKSGDVLWLSRIQEVQEDEHLETWVSTTLNAYANSEDETYRRQMRDEIGKALEKIFQIRQNRQMEDLKALESRFQKLRANLETREKSKADILAHRHDSLLREADGIGWGDGIPAPKRSLPTAGLGIPAGSSSPLSRTYPQPAGR